MKIVDNISDLKTIEQKLMKIIKDKISKIELNVIAKEQFGSLVKVVVDIGREVLAVGGELHADEEAILLEDGSRQEDLWGINLYPEKSRGEWIEFDSMINVRPSQGNTTRGVKNTKIQEKIKNVIAKIVI